MDEDKTDYQTRHKTDYPGVFYRWKKRMGRKGQYEKVYFAVWKEDGKMREALVGYEHRNNMTAARAALVRADFVEGKRKTRQQKRDEAKRNLTIEGIFEEYVKTIKNPNTLKPFRSYFARIPESIRNKRPMELTTGESESWDRAMIQAGYTPQSRKHSLALLKRLIKFGAERGHSEAPKGLRITLPPVDNKKTEFLDDEQMARLFTALDEDHNQLAAGAVRFAIFTGIRRSALFALQWQDVDWERRMLTLRGEHAKSGKSAIIPLSESAIEVLQEAQERNFYDSPWVFPQEKGEQRHALPKDFVRRIREKAQLPPGFRPLHGLRHNFASRLASSGQVDIYTLQQLLTHGNSAMTQRYSHLLDEALHRAAGVVDKVFSQKVEKGD